MVSYRRHWSTGIAPPAFWDRAVHYKEEGQMCCAAASEIRGRNGNR
jgi:hypothetical protein